MTFKHINFEDSPTMRSLARLAQEKGLLQSSNLKVTEAQPDYTVSDNLIENILKLCSGLRTLGQNKYANELEEKYMVYKKAAANLYETSSEKGEDLVDEAHPKGSHKLENVDGDAIVETVIDQHLKMLNVVNKKPNGKLASNTDILNAVKKVIAQDNGVDANIKKIKDSAAAILEKYKSINWFERPRTDAPQNLFDLSVFLSKENVNKLSLQKIALAVESVKRDLKAPLNITLLGGTDEDTWNYINLYLDIIREANHNLLNSLTATKAEPVIDEKIKQFSSLISSALSLLKVWTIKIKTDPENTTKDIQEANKWIDKKNSELLALQSSFNSLNDSEKLQSIDSLTINLNNIKKEFEDFRKVWIG